MLETLGACVSTTVTVLASSAVVNASLILAEASRQFP